MEHKISYTNRGYRIRWVCSCGAADKPHTIVKYWEAERRGKQHLAEVERAESITIGG